MRLYIYPWNFQWFVTVKAIIGIKSCRTESLGFPLNQKGRYDEEFPCSRCSSQMQHESILLTSLSLIQVSVIAVEVKKPQKSSACFCDSPGLNPRDWINPTSALLAMASWETLPQSQVGMSWWPSHVTNEPSGNRVESVTGILRRMVHQGTGWAPWAVLAFFMHGSIGVWAKRLQLELEDYPGFQLGKITSVRNLWDEFQKPFPQSSGDAIISFSFYVGRNVAKCNSSHLDGWSSSGANKEG